MPNVVVLHCLLHGSQVLLNLLGQQGFLVGSSVDYDDAPVHAVHLVHQFAVEVAHFELHLLGEKVGESVSERGGFQHSLDLDFGLLYVTVDPF